jgi:hypothetical protein
MDRPRHRSQTLARHVLPERSRPKGPRSLANGTSEAAVKLLKRKTRKALRKSINKIAKKHGSKIAVGLMGSLASTLATLASTDAPGGHGKRSNLDELSRRLSEAMIAPLDKKSRRDLQSKDKMAKKKTRASKKALRPIDQPVT